MKILVVSLSLIGLFSCTPAPSTPPAPDMGPIGDGLSVIGFSLIAVAVVVTLGKLLK